MTTSFRAAQFVLAVVLAVFASASQTTSPPDEVMYRGRIWLIDAFDVSFNAGSLGAKRRTLFADYVAKTAEGQRRATDAGTSDLEAIWQKALDVEERTTFLGRTVPMATQLISGVVPRFTCAGLLWREALWRWPTWSA